MRYALMICQDETVISGTDPGRVAAFQAFEDELDARGVVFEGLRLQPSTTTTTVQVRDGDLVVADGPFAETREQVAGFYLVECADLDEAIEVASRIPAAGWGTIEVRPAWEL